VGAPRAHQHQRLLLSLGLLAAGASSAQARPKEHVKALHVVKSVIPLNVHVFWVEYQTQTNLITQAVPETLEEGTELDVINTSGWLGRVRVSGISKVSMGTCSGASYQQGTGTFESALTINSFDNNTTVAIGPLSDASRAKVVQPTDLSVFPPPSSDFSQGSQRLFVDLDGDGTADIIRDAGMCTVSGKQGWCLDTRGRSGRGSGAWTLYDSFRIPLCY
jgi:hypothetical protein